MKVIASRVSGASHFADLLTFGYFLSLTHPNRAEVTIECYHPVVMVDSNPATVGVLAEITGADYFSLSGRIDTCSKGTSKINAVVLS